MGDGWAWAAYLYSEEGEMDHREADDNMLRKIEERGYPGVSKLPSMEIRGQAIGPATTQADAIFTRTGVDPKEVLKTQNKPAVWVERLAADRVSYEIQNIPNEQALRVVLDVLPKALELYLNKSRDYGGNVMDRFGLGPKACIPDMARKFGKLIDSIWNEQPLQYEQPDEILMDLFGHIVIILDERRNRNNDDLRRMGQ